MYAKLFASLYQGTLRGRSNEILVFTNLLAHTGKDGTVDKHFRAISEETGLNVDEVKEAIATLEAPDPESRSPEEDGARIVRMDEHRAWGWRVVNHGKYRAIRSEEDRAEQNRLAQKRWRERNHSKQSKPGVSNDKPSKPKQKQEAEAEAEAEAILPKDKPRKPSARAKLSDADFLKSLRENPAYTGHDIDRELGKMQAWLSTPKGRGRKLTQGFVVNWLNRLDAPISATVKKPGRNW